MSNEIVNKVANSKLEVINLEDFYPQGQRESLDISTWLKEGFVLIEKDFRALVKDYDWSTHQDKYICLECSTDAIVPSWAYTLIALSLSGIAKKVVIGDIDAMNSLLYNEILNNTDFSKYKDLPIIIKGCSNKPVPFNAYLFLSDKLKPYAKSIMYGEACSAVPLFKNK